MMPRVPKTRRETARPISLMGGLLLAVYDVSIIMSSSEIENAWSTYIFSISFFWWFCLWTDLAEVFNEDEERAACVDWILVLCFVFKFHLPLPESARYWLPSLFYLFGERYVFFFSNLWLLIFWLEIMTIDDHANRQM